MPANGQVTTNKAELNIFPNPSRGIFYITVIDDGSYQSQVRAMDGSLVKTLYLESGLNYISLQVPPGIYVLEVGTEEEQQNFRIVVK